jgi:hypothetical protein
MEYLDVGVQINNRTYSSYPLKLSENNITNGTVIQSVGNHGQECQIGDVIYDLFFVVRYNIPSEIRDMVEFGETDDPFQHQIKKNLMFAELNKSLKAANMGEDSITISNGQAGSALQSVQICFGLPTTYNFPPRVVSSINLMVQNNGLSESVPQVEYILKGL